MGGICSTHTGASDDALLAAIRDGDDETVESILTNSAYRYKAAPTKFFAWAEQVSALHVAANEGHLGVLKALVELVAPATNASNKELTQFFQFLNKPNSYGQTALMLACKSGHDDIVKYLLSMGADPLVQDKVHFRTCLHYAAWNGKSACINILLSKECTVRLHNGLYGPAPTAIVNDACGRQRMVDMRSESGFTPLHFAVSASKSDAVKALLAQGASITAEVLPSACYSIWPVQSTALHIAAAKGNHHVVRHLLQAQISQPHLADMRLRSDANGRRPHDIAQSLSHGRIEFMLDPETPLHRAVSTHSQRAAMARGVPPLTVLAGRILQVTLLAELDVIAWQLRFKDGPSSAAMPRTLKRQLLKASKSAKLKVEVSGQQEESIVDEGGSSANSDSESRATEGLSVAEPSGTSMGELVPLEDLKLQEIDESVHDGEINAVEETGTSECGVCLDRSNQVTIGECMHECCHKCAATIVKKTKLAKGSIKCPFCRGLVTSFQLKDTVKKVSEKERM